MELAEAARDEAAFAMSVLRHLACGGGDASLAVSPLSIHAALALLGAGAKGDTLDQIVAFLGPAGGRAHATLASHVALHVLSDSAGDDGGPTVRFANGVWVDAALRLRAGYAAVVSQRYRSQARPASFKAMPEEARAEINQWFESVTAGRITELLPRGCIDSDTLAVLGNAIYFKGAWRSKFDPRNTRDDTFYLHAFGHHVRAPFMSTGEPQYIACRSGYKVLRLPYALGRGRDHGGESRRCFSMYIYLPNERHGLQALLQMLGSSPALLEDCWSLMTEVPVGAFKVPKFTVSCKTDATELLKDLGLRMPFDPRADFSDMLDPAAPLVVSAVLHQAFVEVNEEGTEAAAATAVVGGFTCQAPMRTPVQVVDFVADHPFMFLIKEDLTGVVVFAGQVVNPLLS
ncbi:serpin-Z1-like [Lolium rigidum]|uniref:serpin-Z1-like n=1 Tax=Lolium rigidum TaxID=89674 RepID=UPI001F5D752B|nr:serpin-Z1-like [Lolium rigidum]